MCCNSTFVSRHACGPSRCSRSKRCTETKQRRFQHSGVFSVCMVYCSLGASSSGVCTIVFTAFCSVSVCTFGVVCLRNNFRFLLFANDMLCVSCV